MINDKSIDKLMAGAFAVLCIGILLTSCTGCTSYTPVVDPVAGTTSWEPKGWAVEDVPADLSTTVGAEGGEPTFVLKAEMSPYYVLSYDRTVQAEGVLPTLMWGAVDTVSVPYRIGAGAVGSFREEPLPRDAQGWAEITGGTITTLAAGYGAYYLYDKNQNGDADPPQPAPIAESDVSFSIGADNNVQFAGNGVRNFISSKKKNESGSGQAFVAGNLTAEEIAALAGLGLFE